MQSLRPTPFLTSWHFSKKKTPLPGFDIMVDSDLEPHLLEVNTKPQLLPLPLDRSVIFQSALFDSIPQYDDLLIGKCADDLRNVANCRVPLASL